MLWSIDQVVAFDDCVYVCDAPWTAEPPPPPPFIVIEAVPALTVALTPVPIKSKYDAVPCVLPSSPI